jgi:hypothetical protein
MPPRFSLNTDLTLGVNARILSVSSWFICLRATSELDTKGYILIHGTNQRVVCVCVCWGPFHRQGYVK